MTLLLTVLLGAAGLDLMVTGALGHCPLYAAWPRAGVPEEVAMTDLEPHDRYVPHPARKGTVVTVG